MKKGNLLIALTIVSMAISFTACKKLKNNVAADATTAKITGQSAISDNLTEDANDIFAQTANDSAQLGAARPAPYYSFSSVTITSGAYPKTVTIDFGTGTTSLNGITRSGIIKVILSDSFRLAGTTDSLYFVNYAVNGYRKTGSIVWLNQTSGDTLQWQRTDSGTVIAPDNVTFWHHSGIRHVIQTAGFGGPLYDNIYAISGSHNFVNSDNVSFSSYTILPLEKSADCFWIDKGQIRINGPQHYAIIDFGDGTCDANATYSLDGGTSFPFSF
jgi:hypothetical protein